MTSPIVYATKALDILRADRGHLDKLERYYRGDHDMPYMPDTAEAEYRLLARKARTNWCKVVTTTPAQALYVDNFRKGDSAPGESLDDSLEWKSWQNSRLDGRQNSVYVDALKFGHGFTLTEKDPKTGKVITKGLPARRTVCLYEDPATDLDPVAAVYVKKWPTDAKVADGVIYVWDETHKYELSFRLGAKPTQTKFSKHGAGECPVTRFTCDVDSEGRTTGVIEPIIDVQDRLNQTIFDLLVSQTYNSFEVRTITGMAPPMKTIYNPDTGLAEPLLDADGNPQPDRMYFNATRMMFAEAPDAKFGSLPGGSLDGFIASAELALRHIAALSQTPPHFMLGQIANISAQALEAAETALSRKVELLRTSFGESWERVFRMTSTLLSEEVSEDFSGEVIWRDLGMSSMAQTADALGKFAESLDIPKRGLWGRVPKVSRAEMSEWMRLRDEENIDKQIVETAAGMRGGTATRAAAVPNSFGAEAMSGADTAAG